MTSSQNRRTNTGPSSDRRSTFLRAFLVLAVIGAVFLTLGSMYVNDRVKAALHARGSSASSAVFARPVRLTPGANIDRLGLVKRLGRLGYHPVDDAPSQPGQYLADDSSITIFLRGTTGEDGSAIPPSLIQLRLGQGHDIISMYDVKFREPIKEATLEPEMLALWSGESEGRATDRRPLRDFPPHLINAILAIEDERYYHHIGIDPIAVLRALTVNMRSGGVMQGGSTITQQLVKNLLLSQERVIWRKIVEAAGAILLEFSYSKDQILELYMNEIFLTQEGSTAIHGFAEAAQSFFRKDVRDLSLAEAATLAGMIRAPSRYSPRRNPEEARDRRLTVLAKMRELGEITDIQKELAGREELKVFPPQRSNSEAPYFVDYLRRTLTPQVEQAGPHPLAILSTIDSELQLCAKRALKQGLFLIEERNRQLRRHDPPLEAALVAVLPSTGEVVAYVGGRDYQRSQFDRASLARRQPGSAFKPFVYLTALDGTLNNYRVAKTTTTLGDEPVRIPVPGGVWEPQNYDRRYRGEVTVRYALEHSLNIPTIELAQKVGIDFVARTGELFGFGEHLPRVPSLALGAGEVTPLELARAYGALANGGELVELRTVRTVVDASTHQNLFTPAPQRERVASSAAVYVLTDILKGVIDHGTGSTIRTQGFTRPAAGKTGTTDSARDAWFAGYTPELLAVVWIGFDDNSILGFTGGAAAAPLWAEFMKCAQPYFPAEDFKAPRDVVTRTVDNATGLLYSSECPGAQPLREVFVEGTEPTDYCYDAQAEAPESAPQPNSQPEEYNHEDDYLPDQPPLVKVPQPRAPARQPRPRPTKEKSFWDDVLPW